MGLAQCLSQLERVEPYQAACDIALSIACKGDASCCLYGGVTVAFVERNGVFSTDVGSNESLSNVFSVKVINETLEKRRTNALTLGVRMYQKVLNVGDRMSIPDCAD